MEKPIASSSNVTNVAEPESQQTSFVDIVQVVDAIIRRCEETRTPAIPRNIAVAVAAVFFRGFRDEDLATYKLQTEVLVRDRLWVFVLTEERIGVNLFRKGN
jgi:hypothetical protein